MNRFFDVAWLVREGTVFTYYLPVSLTLTISNPVLPVCARVTLFEHCSLTVAEGEKVAIIGEPGVGKRALLNILGLLDTCCYADPRACCQTWNLPYGGTRKSGSCCRNLRSSAPLSIVDNVKLLLLHVRTPGKGNSGRSDQLVDALWTSGLSWQKPLE